MNFERTHSGKIFGTGIGLPHLYPDISSNGRFLYDFTPVVGNHSHDLVAFLLLKDKLEDLPGLQYPET